MTGRVLVSGATGVLGRATVPLLVARGWRVTGVARADDAAERLRAGGASAARVDLFDAGAVSDAVAGHDAVVHLATAIPPMARMHRRSAWSTNDRLRVDATCHLVAAARDHGVARVVMESVTFPYCDGGDAWLDESAPLDPGAAWQATLAGERLVRAYGDAGADAVILRFGLLYARDARMAEEFRRLVRLRLMPVPGPPDAFVSSIRADDAAAAVVAALSTGSGTYNVVDARPLRRREYGAALACAFGVARVRSVPSAPLRWIGGDGVRALLASQRVSSEAFRRAGGWEPRWPDAADGWADLMRDASGSAR